MERLTAMMIGLNGVTHDTYDPIDIVQNDYSIENFQKVLKKLAYYEDLEEQGILIKLPCKIGDIVYFKAREIIKCKVFAVEFNKYYDAIWIEYAGENDLLKLWKSAVLFSEIGKTLFLTKEDAEKALAEMG